MGLGSLGSLIRQERSGLGTPPRLVLFHLLLVCFSRLVCLFRLRFETCPNHLIHFLTGERLTFEQRFWQELR